MTEHTKPNPEMMADAYLIRAAPDLLAALEALLGADSDALNDIASRVWTQARAAIAKARGGRP